MAVKVQYEVKWEGQLLEFQNCQVASIINNNSMPKMINSICNKGNLCKS